MGCDKICQAKKQAADAQRQADAAMRAPPPAGPNIPNVPIPTGVNVKITTVGHVLGVHEKKNALNPKEVFAILGVAQGNSQIRANSTASGLVTPIRAAFGVYAGLIIAQVALTILKPAVKIAVQINGIIVFNFAMLPELIADIGLLILMIFVGLAPIFLSLLKNIFLSIPLDVGIMTTYQLAQIKTLIELSKIQIKITFMKVVVKINAYKAIKIANTKKTTKASLGGTTPKLIGYAGTAAIIKSFMTANPPASNIPYYTLAQVLGGTNKVEELRKQFVDDFVEGMDSCKEIILEELGEELKSQSIDILEVEGVDQFDIENKNKAREVADGLQDASKKIELLQSGEILKRQFSSSSALPTQDGQVFDDIGLAIAAGDNMIEELERQLANNSSIVIIPPDVDEIFLTILSDEIEKKKGKTLEIREDLAAIELAQELILQNKNAFVSSMIDVVNKIKLDKSKIVLLDPCYEQSITNSFTILKSTTQTQQASFINSFTVTNTADMISLRDAVFANTNQSIIDALITVDPACQSSFGESVCDSIDKFKRAIYAEVKVSIEKGSIPIDKLEVPAGIDKHELKKMMNILLDEVKKKLVKQSMDILIEEALPCKSCKPCEDMIVDMNIFVSKTIQKSKDNMLKSVLGYIVNSGHTWTITDAGSIVTQKNFLINQLNMALQKPSGELQLIDDMMFRLEMEEEELIKNIKTSLRAV